ncbi:MAG: endo-1,4-beta-xylanase, partial [Chitinophagaceae bacterium]|nr:endo-1,4-beta-xylanase [Chitinophagaceae bacterium]
MTRTLIYLLSLTVLLSTAQTAQSQVPEGVDVLPEALTTLKPYGPEIPATLVQTSEVTGESFPKALRINTIGLKPGEYGLKAGIPKAFKKNDVLWVSFKVRTLESKKETGEAFIELRVDQLVNGKFTWPSHLERGLSIGANWTEISIPFIIKKDVAPEDARLMIEFDKSPQRLEIGPVKFLNYGPNVQLDQLPRSIVKYDGGEPDAMWRKAAAERIAKYRKGLLTVKVVNKKGEPVKGATVAVNMKKSAFSWGTATDSKLLLDSVTPAHKTYRDTLLRYFNKIVFENEIKSKYWARSDHYKIIQALDWLRKNDINARGHVMVWPSWQHSPHLEKFKNDTAALRQTILELITQQTTVLKDRFAEWDVVNEPFAHHGIIDSLGGKRVMIDWFAAAKKNAPTVQLFLNDYTMFHAKGEGSDVFYDNVKFLVDNNAPI